MKKSGRREWRCCFGRHVAEIEGPDRKMWLTSLTRLFTIFLVMCCAACGSKNWLTKNTFKITLCFLHLMGYPSRTVSAHYSCIINLVHPDTIAELIPY